MGQIRFQMYIKLIFNIKLMQNILDAASNIIVYDRFILLFVSSINIIGVYYIVEKEYPEFVFISMI